LPRRLRGREHFFDPHRLRRGPEALERMIAVVKQVARRLVPRERLA
jgi:hypothetical protein